MTPTVLVTGGAGFIGSAIARRLAPAVHRWVVLDVLHQQVHEGLERPTTLPEEAELRVADVTDHEAWDSLLSDVQPDVVLHLAAETGTAQSLREASRHAAVNVLGTTAMLDAFARTGHVPSRFILSSSRAVYGEGEWRRDGGEVFAPGARSHAQLQAAKWDFADATPIASEAGRTAPNPTSVYGATKLAQEHLIRAWTASFDTDVTMLRLQNVYGPGQSLINPYTGIVSLFSRLARAGRSIPLYEDGEIVRDFVYIDDVVEAFTCALDHAGTPGSVVLDIGSGRTTSIAELAETIASYHGAPVPHVSGEFRDGDVRHSACRVDAAAVELGWTPSWALTDGIAALQGWIADEEHR